MVQPVKLFSELLLKEKAETVAEAEKLPGGVNSEVYKLTTHNGGEYLGKKYFEKKGNKRDRLSSEFYGLSFLWSNGIRCVPEPVAIGKKGKIGIYGFIRGRKLGPGEMTLKDVDSAADFAGKLHGLTSLASAQKQPAASESCFSLKEYRDAIGLRLGKIPGIRGVMKKKTESYISDEFLPFLGIVDGFVVREAARGNIEMDTRLERFEMTLSQSDFGFHNVIKAESGDLFFIDFEYFGWDDPAKEICDFFLQPAVPVPAEFRKNFYDKSLAYFGNDKKLVTRLPFAYLYSALKWCLLFLNPLMEHAESGIGTHEAQLEKARDKLRQIKKEFADKEFPISLFTGG